MVLLLLLFFDLFNLTPICTIAYVFKRLFLERINRKENSSRYVIITHLRVSSLVITCHVPLEFLFLLLSLLLLYDPLMRYDHWLL